MKMKKKAAALVLLALAAGALYAEDIRVVVPYVGAVTSVYKDNDLDLDGTGLMTGLYLQWINPDLFQANAFVDYAPDVIDAPVIGGHLISDFYVWSDPLGKAAVGAGLEVLQPSVETEIMPGPTGVKVTTDLGSLRPRRTLLQFRVAQPGAAVGVPVGGRRVRHRARRGRL